MKKKPVKGGRRSTVLQEQATIEATCLAEMGKGNELIRSKYNVNLTDGQFQYRLTKAKTAAGLKKGDGFRKAWREGRSPYEDAIEAVLPIARKHYKQTILPQVEKPAPTVDEAIEELNGK